MESHAGPDAAILTTTRAGGTASVTFFEKSRNGTWPSTEATVRTGTAIDR